MTVAPAAGQQPSCPQCGAPVAPVDEPLFLDCAHCGARLYVEAGARDEWIAPALSRSEAGARLVAGLQDRECAGRPRLLSAHLVFVPFWQRATTPGLRLVPASPELATEVEGWHTGGADRLPLDAEALRRHGEPLESTLEPPEPGMSRLLVPFWEVRFSLGPASYRAWVEAVSGRIVAPVDPPTRETGLNLIYALLLLGCGVVLALGFRLVWTGGAWAALGVGVLALVATLAPRAGRALVRRVEERR